MKVIRVTLRWVHWTGECGLIVSRSSSFLLELIIHSYANTRPTAYECITSSSIPTTSERLSVHVEVVEEAAFHDRSSNAASFRTLLSTVRLARLTGKDSTSRHPRLNMSLGVNLLSREGSSQTGEWMPIRLAAKELTRSDRSICRWSTVKEKTNLSANCLAAWSFLSSNPWKGIPLRFVNSWTVQPLVYKS